MKFQWSLLAPRCWPTWLGLGLLRVVTLLPYRLLLVLGAFLGHVLLRLPLRYVDIARRNLALCFPELSVAERERLLRGHFVSLGIALFEVGLAWWGGDERLRALTQVHGLEHLEAARARGRGVLLLAAHFTTLEIGARALNLRLPISLMYRPTKNPVLARFLARQRSRRVRRAIPRDEVRTLIAALAANETVWYATDQAFRKKGAGMVSFFGVPAATNLATSRLARISGAAVLPYFSERLAGGRGYRVTIQPALENFPSGNTQDDAQRLTALIETQVRRTPDQYLWIHRRFKGLTHDYPDYYAKN